MKYRRHTKMKHAINPFGAKHMFVRVVWLIQISTPRNLFANTPTAKDKIATPTLISDISKNLDLNFPSWATEM